MYRNDAGAHGGSYAPPEVADRAGGPDIDSVSAMCRALGDPTRMRIYRFLLSCSCPVELGADGSVRPLDGPTVGEVCCTVAGVEQITSTLSFHLRRLREAGLIAMERRGRRIACSVIPSAAQQLAGFFADANRSSAAKGEQTMTDGSPSKTDQDVHDAVRERYGRAASAVLGRVDGAAGCCSGLDGDGQPANADPITRDLYSSDEAASVPTAALAASLGCGNPTALASLQPGQTVLDLGSGGGVDVLLSARRVGPTGFAYGLDMTDEMLDLAERNRAEAGVDNVRFLKGRIEDIPLPDGSVDVIISNCVINLSADKDAVLREAFRVLRPGGRFAVSDVVWRRPIPEAIRGNVELWAGCVAGALLEGDYRDRLLRTGFAGVSIEPTRVYTREDAEAAVESACGSGGCCGSMAEELDGALMSAFIRAVKPAA